MKRKKVAALMMAAIMTASALLAGCGDKSADKGDSNTQGSSEEQESADVADTEEQGEPTEATLVLYGESSARMSEFSENEFKEKVLEAINVDVTIQYLPWSEYAGGKTELMLSSGEKFVTYTDTAFLSKHKNGTNYVDR